MIDFSQVTDILLGNTPVEQVSDSRGNVLWSSLPNYFYVEDISGAANTLSIANTNNDVYYSTDESNWTLFNGTATIPANGRLYLKANINTWSKRTISASGNHNVGGNIMSLLYGDEFEGKTEFPEGTTYNYWELFAGNTHLISAANLILPPTVTSDCYTYAFGGCTSLTEAPALPATALADRCYWDMFGGCTSLTTAPILPATTMVTNCYYAMFRGCASLTTAPVLPATTLAPGCYREMFQSCTNLNSVTAYAQDISASGCLLFWLNGASLTGDFYNLGGATYESGVSGIPTGWTEHTPSVPINVTIINTDGYTGATYQIDSETAQPVNVTGNTTFTVPATATTLTVNRNGKGSTIFTGVSGLTEDNHWTTAIPVQDMSSNVTIEFMNLM